MAIVTLALNILASRDRFAHSLLRERPVPDRRVCFGRGYDFFLLRNLSSFFMMSVACP